MAKQKEETAAAEAVEVQQEGSLLDRILTEGKMARDDYQKERAKDMIGEFVGQVMSGELTMSKNMDVAINSRIAEIDRLISAQMNEVMHHEEFQKLEGSWRGLQHLVRNSLTGPFRMGHIRGNDRGPRRFEDLRPYGIYEVAKLPRIGGFTIRRPYDPARFDA